jgi:hypothetical protein
MVGKELAYYEITEKLGEGGVLYMWWFQVALRGDQIGRVLCFEEGGDWSPFESRNALRV